MDSKHLANMEVSGLTRCEWEVTHWQCLELPVQHSLGLEEVSLIKALTPT